jgi:hypothetical protein
LKGKFLSDPEFDFTLETSGKGNWVDVSGYCLGTPHGKKKDRKERKKRTTFQVQDVFPLKWISHHFQ